jgi:hypothetical protein
MRALYLLAVADCLGATVVRSGWICEKGVNNFTWRMTHV